MNQIGKMLLDRHFYSNFNNKRMNENGNYSGKESEGQNISKGCKMGIDDLVIMNVQTAPTKLHQQDGAGWTI